MATLYIAEFPGLGSVGSIQPQIAGVPPLAEQTVTIGGSSTQSNALNAKTRVVRLMTDTACSVAFGTNPTAAATNLRLAANSTEYFAVASSSKIAVIS